MTIKKFSGLRKFTPRAGRGDVEASRLVRVLAEDSFLLSDEEVEEQLRRDGDDPDAVVRRMRESIASLVGSTPARVTDGRIPDVAVASMSIEELRDLIAHAIAHPLAPARLVEPFRANAVRSETDLRALAEELAALRLLSRSDDSSA